MPAYNTRSGVGARGVATNPVPGTADNRAAGTVQESADSQVELDPTSEWSTDRSREVTGTNGGTMADFPQSLKDASLLILHAEFKAAHIAVDRSVTEIDKHISDIEQAKAGNTVPKGDAV